MTNSKFYGTAAAAAGIILYLTGLFYLKGIGWYGFSWNMDGWFKWHLAGGCIGLLIAAGIVLAGYRRFLKLTPYAAAVAVFLLVLALFYPEYHYCGGEYRQFDCPKGLLYFAAGESLIGIYPAELVKTVFCMLMAVFCGWWNGRSRSGTAGFGRGACCIFSLPVFFVFGYLLLEQYDIRNFCFFYLVFVCAVMFMRPFPVWYLAGLFACPVLALVKIYFFDPMRYAGISAFFRATAPDDQYFPVFALLENLSWAGNGTGSPAGFFELNSAANSVFKLNDIMDRGGILMLCAIILLYLVLIAAGVMTGLQCKDWKGKVLCITATAFLCFQILLNFCVVFNITGFANVTAPFIGYGSSNLLFAFAALGCIVSVAFTREPEADGACVKI